MKQIFESEQTFQAYAAIDFGYWRIEQIKLEMEKPVSPINQMIDAATGFDKAQRTDWTAEAIDNRRGLFARRGIFREIEREIMSEKTSNAEGTLKFAIRNAIIDKWHLKNEIDWVAKIADNIFNAILDGSILWATKACVANKDPRADIWTEVKSVDDLPKDDGTISQWIATLRFGATVWVEGVRFYGGEWIDYHGNLLPNGNEVLAYRKIEPFQPEK